MSLKEQIASLSPNAKKTLGLLAQGFSIRHGLHGFKRGAVVPDKGTISLKEGNSLNISAASVREIRDALPSMVETYEHNIAEGWKTVLYTRHQSEVARVLDELANPVSDDGYETLFSSSVDVVLMPNGQVAISDGFLTDYVVLQGKGKWQRESDQLPLPDDVRQYINGLDGIPARRAQSAPARDDGEITLIASHAGDSSVGIDGETAEIKLNAGGFGHDDRAEYIEHAKEVMAEAFAKLWDFPVRVQTAAEIEAEAKAMEGASARSRGMGL